MPNLGQDATATARARSKVLKDAVLDNHPLLKAMKDKRGIKYKSGGRDIVEEAKMAQNSTVAFVGQAGSVTLADTDIMDAANYDWRYLLGSATWTLAEQLQNRGEWEYINLLGAKMEVLEDSLANLLHSSVVADGTTLHYTNGIANLVNATASTGTVGGLDRSVAANAWIRNQQATTTTACGDATADAANIKRILDYAIDNSLRHSQVQQTLGFLGGTHWQYANQAIQAHQVINDKNDVGHIGFDKIRYRGIDLYNGAGITFSSLTQNITATRSYLLCVKPGGLNLVYMKGAEFDMLEPVNSANQATVSRLMFTMVQMIIGGLAKFNYVITDG
jgi:hypothetical protein